MPLWKQAQRILLYSLLLSFVFGINRVAAQDQTIIRLDMPSTALQTGQVYEVALRVENAPQFWALDLTLEYDPSLIYVMGTKSGSPIVPGELFSGISAIMVVNKVEGNQIRFTITKVGETTPAEGSGVVGVLRIYPLSAGSTRMQFPRLQAVGLSSYDVNATDVTTEEIPVVPALLDLTITGETVEPPSEATATPEPTEVIVEATPILAQDQPTAVPTLENIVFLTATPTPIALQEVPTAPPGDNSSVVIIGAVLIAIAVLGLGGLMMTQRGKRK